MDFFAQQALARKRSFRLGLLYLAGIVLLALLAALVIEALLGSSTGMERAALGRNTPFHQDFLLILAGLAAFLGLTGLFRYLTIRAGGHKVAQSLHGRLLVPQSAQSEERRLLNIVEEMALASGMPVPGVYVLDHESGINAFAAGYSVNDAVIGVTRGALEQLDRDELQAVIGHEFSHIQNGDMRLNMRFAALLFGLLCLTEIARIFTRLSGSGRGSDSRARGAAVLAALVLYVTGILMSLWGKLMQAAINRQREYLADASSVQFTRSTALAAALKKIGGQGSRLEAAAATNYSHLFFGPTAASLFATHPPLKKRILALEPDWDGQFTAPASVPLEEPDQSGQPTRRASAVAVDDPWAALRSTPTLVVSALAEARSAPASGSGAVRAEGEDAPGPTAMDRLLAASREPLDAGYLILALLLDPDVQMREIQVSLVGNRALLENYAHLLQEVPASKRLELAELCVPALKLLSGDQYRDLLRIMQHMVEADQMHTFQEWLLCQFVVRNVGAIFRGKAAERSLYSAPAQLERELSLVLSAFASLSDPAQAAQAFVRAVRELGLPSPTYAGQPAVADLQRDLDKIRRASPALKSAFLRAARNVLDYDRVVIQEEKMLYRLVALYLDLPPEI